MAIKKNVWTMLASLGGAGFVPKMPGTVGSLVSLPFIWGINHWPFIVSAICFSLMLPLAFYSAHRACLDWGTWDDQRVVIDETMGMWIACFGLLPTEWAWFGVAFLAFRIFDIIKPWPASFFDKRCKNGVGVVMDDVAAGIFALASVQILKLLLTGMAIFR